jgi:hypothetical protein
LKVEDHDHIGEDGDAFDVTAKRKDLRKFYDHGHDEWEETDEIKDLSFSCLSSHEEEKRKDIPYRFKMKRDAFSDFHSIFLPGNQKLPEDCHLEM